MGAKDKVNITELFGKKQHADDEAEFAARMQQLDQQIAALAEKKKSLHDEVMHGKEKYVSITKRISDLFFHVENALDDMSYYEKWLLIKKELKQALLDAEMPDAKPEIKS